MSLHKHGNFVCSAVHPKAIISSMAVHTLVSLLVLVVTGNNKGIKDRTNAKIVTQKK